MGVQVEEGSGLGDGRVGSQVGQELSAVTQPDVHPSSQWTQAMGGMAVVPGVELARVDR